MTRQRPLAVLALSLVALPFAMRAIGMTESLGTEIALFALVGLGFNLLLGYTGLLSFGHGLFFGFAAYAAALSQLHWFHDSLVWPMFFAVAATALPSGANEIDVIIAVCPASAARSRPLSGSNNRTVPSPKPVASSLPSREKATV